LDKKLFQNITNDKFENFLYLSTHQDRFIYIINTVNHYFKENKNLNILDFGSHTGVLSVLFQYYGFNVHSIDLDTVIEDNKDIYIQNDLKVDRLNENWETLPYEDNYFDSVIFTEVLEHLYESPIHILQELHRVLKANGVLILTTPNVMKLENKLSFFLNINIYQDIERFCYNPRYSIYFREYDQKDLKILLTKFIKFRKLEFHYFDYVGGRTILKRNIQRVLYMITKVFFMLRGSILVIAKK